MSVANLVVVVGVAVVAWPDDAVSWPYDAVSWPDDAVISLNGAVTATSIVLVVVAVVFDAVIVAGNGVVVVVDIVPAFKVMSRVNALVLVLVFCLFAGAVMLRILLVIANVVVSTSVQVPKPVVKVLSAAGTATTRLAKRTAATATTRAWCGTRMTGPSGTVEYLVRSCVPKDEVTPAGMSPMVLES